MKQVRKVKQNYRSVTGYVAYKGEPIPFESTLERDFLAYYTFDPYVEKIIAQPVKIEFRKYGNTYHYTPDFFVEFKAEVNRKPILVEVKYKKDWQENWHDWKEKWKSAMRFCKEKGFVFHIYDEDRIRHKALENIEFLRTYKNTFCEKEDIEAVLQRVEMMGCVTIDHILAALFQGAISRPQGERVIFHLLANKVLGCDLFSDINDFTVVWRFPHEPI